MYVMLDKRECQEGVSFRLRCQRCWNCGKQRLEGCVNTRNRQQIGVGGACRACMNVVTQECLFLPHVSHSFSLSTCYFVSVCIQDCELSELRLTIDKLRTSTPLQLPSSLSAACSNASPANNIAAAAPGLSVCLSVGAFSSVSVRR